MDFSLVFTTLLGEREAVFGSGLPVQSACGRFLKRGKKVLSGVITFMLCYLILCYVLCMTVVLRLNSLGTGLGCAFCL